MTLPATDTFTVAGDINLGDYANWDDNTPSTAAQVEAATDRVLGQLADYHGGHWSSDTFNDNQYAQCKHAATGGQEGPAVRCAPSAVTFYAYYAGQTGWGSEVVKSVAGSDTVLEGGGADGVINSVYRLEANGTTLTPYKDGSVADLGAQTDGDITSGSAGLAFWGAGVADDWEGGNLSSGATLTVADASCTSQVDAPTLTKESTLAVADASCESQADALTLTGPGNLEVADGFSTSQVDAPTLTQEHNLIVSDAFCESQADAPAVNVAGDLVVADASVDTTADAIVLGYPGNVEQFEDIVSNWIVETDTSGTGSAVARSATQKRNGTYSAECTTTNSGAKAQVRDVINSTWAGVPVDSSVFVWQRAHIYVPSATANALTAAEYLDLAAIYVSADASGWYLRLMENAALWGVGPGTGGQSSFNLYATLPLDQWVEIKVGLWSRASGDLDRAGCFMVDGKFYGWFTKGEAGTDYTRTAMGIVATNSSDDLTVFVDDWYIFSTSETPPGTDLRPNGNNYYKAYTDQDGENVGYHYTTWENGYTFNATYGLTPANRIQSGFEHSLMDDLSNGWSQIVIDWAGGATPPWPPDAMGEFYAPMVAFRKSVELEENLEIVLKYRSGTTDMVFESWTIAAVEYAEWEIPVDHVVGQRVPGRGDIIRVFWQEVSATQIRVRVDYYDASANTWTIDAIDTTQTLNNVSGVDFLADTHRAVTNTIDSNDYTIVSQTLGTLDSWLVVADAAVTTQADAPTLTTGAVTLAVDDCSCDTQADAATLTGEHNLVLADAFSESQADAVALTQEHNLVVPDAFATTQADALTIIQVGVVFLRPTSDLLDGSWTNQAGSAVNLYESINEAAPPDDGDFIQSEWSPTDSPCALGLEAGTDPLSSAGHVLRYRYGKVGGEAASVVVQLRQGYVNESNLGTLIAEWTHADISTSLTTAEQTLTAEQADAITDYGGLSIRLVAP